LIPLNTLVGVSPSVVMTILFWASLETYKVAFEEPVNVNAFDEVTDLVSGFLTVTLTVPER